MTCTSAEVLVVVPHPDDAEICGCNGVSKGDIVQAISKNGIFTLEEVRAHTKASSSCGSCTGLVENILASTVGEGYVATPNKKARVPVPNTAMMKSSMRSRRTN